MIASLEELANIRTNKKKIARVGLVSAEDEHSIRAILDERLHSMIEPILIGSIPKIIKLLADIDHPFDDVEIINADTKVEAADKASSLAKMGKIDVLMKGEIMTKDFLKPIVNPTNNLIEKKLLSHIALFELPTYNKILITSDGGMVLEPTYDQKLLIIKNSLEVAYKLGYKKPKIAVLAAAELVNQKIKSSVEAEKLMNDFLNMKDYPCDIDGPISLDLAISEKISKLKNYNSLVSGRADILIGPDMTAMNLLGKSFSVIGQGQMAGIVYGAKIPIIMTSRGSSTMEKYYSIVLASSIGGEE